MPNEVLFESVPLMRSSISSAAPKTLVPFSKVVNFTLFLFEDRSISPPKVLLSSSSSSSDVSLSLPFEANSI